MRLKFDYNVARNPENLDTDSQDFIQIIEKYTKHFD